MIDPIQLAFRLSLVVFMVGNMSSMGLQLRISEACRPLKDIRFVLTALFSGFVIGPALAQLVALAVPMQQPYTMGLLLLGMTPCAPFLPLVVRRANGDLAAAAGLMLLASVGAILVIPIGAPLVAPGLSASAWSVARPLLLLLLLPLAASVAIKSRWPAAADRIYLYVTRITVVGTLVFLALILVLNFQSFIGSVGSHALLAQLIFVPALTLGGYLSALGMPLCKRSAISLGTGTRNIGAAAAIIGAEGDKRALVMLVIAMIVTIIVSFAVAAWFARRSQELP
jgi:BASS family bile acid:Na+ symporter